MNFWVSYSSLLVFHHLQCSLFKYIIFVAEEKRSDSRGTTSNKMPPPKGPLRDIKSPRISFDEGKYILKAFHYGNWGFPCFLEPLKVFQFLEIENENAFSVLAPHYCVTCLSHQGSNSKIVLLLNLVLVVQPKDPYRLKNYAVWVYEQTWI